MIKINYKTDISRFIKRELRKVVNAHNNCPVVIVGGDSPPKLCGHKFHYENKSGDIIRHVNAYKKAWGKPIYIHSSLHVEVGADWLLYDFTLEKLRLHKLRVFS
jgi:hypothetical protein